MEKENNFNCPCICVCLCVTVFIFCFFASKVVGLDWNLWTNLFFIVLLILFTICTCILTKVWYDNKKILSEIKTTQKQIIDNYKDILKKEASVFFSCSSNTNDSLYKTIDKITEAFSNKKNDSSSLSTFKDVISTIMEYEKDLHAKTDCEQNEEDEKTDNKENISK